MSALSDSSAHALALEKVRLGTCAWNFEDWRDVFYPPGLASTQELTYYAHYLHAVEIDSTFYAPPRPEVVAAWADKTPENFVFTAKMPRRITHELALRDSGPELLAFLGALRPFGPKLGAVLIQFPASFRREGNERALRDFLALLPPEPRFAIEFRHPSWRHSPIARLLEAHRVCWVWNDLSAYEAQAEAAFDPLPRTADFLYVRLMGNLETKFRPGGERRYRYGSLLWPRDQGLENWASRIVHHLVDLQKIFVMINNHYEGFSPLTCRRLGRLLGIDLELPSLVTHGAPPGAGPKEKDEQMELL